MENNKCLKGPTRRLSSRLCVVPHIFVWGSCFWFCIPGFSSAASSSRLLLHTHTHTHTHTHIPTHTHTHPHTNTHTHTHTHAHTHTPTHQHTHTHSGRRGTYGTGWRAWTGFRRHTHTHTVAGVALMAMGGALGLGLGARDARDAAPLLRGRRGTWWHPPSFHVAGVAQPHIYRRFAWQAWYTWHWVARLDWV